MLSSDAAKGKFTHERIDDLVENQLTADQGATYAKSLYLNLVSANLNDFLVHLPSFSLICEPKLITVSRNTET